MIRTSREGGGACCKGCACCALLTGGMVGTIAIVMFILSLAVASFFVFYGGILSGIAIIFLVPGLICYFKVKRKDRAAMEKQHKEGVSILGYDPGPGSGPSYGRSSNKYSFYPVTPEEQPLAAMV